MSTERTGCEGRKKISRREMLGLAAAAGMLAGCSSVDAATPIPSATLTPTPTEPPTATLTPSPMATSTAASIPLPTATPSPTATPRPLSTATPTTTATPAPTAYVLVLGEAPQKASVAFVKTSDRVHGIRKAVEMLAIDPVEDKTVLLKPNFNSADPAPGSTHLDTLRTLVVMLQGMGSRHITVGDRSGMGVTERVMQKLGVYELAEELGFEVLAFDTLDELDDWVVIQPPGSHWEAGFAVPRLCIDADAIVQTCCLKTHQYGGHFTMSLKNSVGLVAGSLPQSSKSYMTELHQDRYQRARIAEINTAYTPALIVLDGVEAFTLGGPATGKLVSSQVVLAGTDRIAIDAVGVALLRHFGTTTQVMHGPIFQQDQIARAVELGLGVDHPDKIELITADADSAAYAAEILEILTAG